MEEAFAGFVDQGYEVVDRHYSAEHFGNGWVTYRKGGVRVEILRDRGDHSADFWTPDTESERIAYWLLHRHLGRGDAEDPGFRRLDRFSAALLADLDEIERVIAPDRVAETMKACRADYEAWFEARFGHVPRRGDDVT